MRYGPLSKSQIWVILVHILKMCSFLSESLIAINNMRTAYGRGNKEYTSIHDLTRVLGLILF